MTPAERFYRSLLGLYPRVHRDRYGGLMLTHFRDLWRDVQQAEHRSRIAFWWLILTDTLETLVVEHLEELRQNPIRSAGRGVLFAAGLLVLLFTWVELFAWFYGFTRRLLAPWYGVPVPSQTGELARAANGFFASPVGLNLPGCLFVGLSALLFLSGLLRAGVRPSLPWWFVLTNVVFFVGGAVVIDRAAWLAHDVLQAAQLAPGYAASVPGLIGGIASTVLWLYVQTRISWRSGTQQSPPAVLEVAHG